MTANGSGVLLWVMRCFGASQKPWLHIVIVLNVTEMCTKIVLVLCSVNFTSVDYFFLKKELAMFELPKSLLWVWDSQRCGRMGLGGPVGLKKNLSVRPKFSESLAAQRRPSVEAPDSEPPPSRVSAGVSGKPGPAQLLGKGRGKGQVAPAGSTPAEIPWTPEAPATGSKET